ncbi:MAG: type II secretion system protein [Candidatus Omnitrophota bacterium]
MKKGFTLIELLIVIAIISILAVAIIPNFIGFDTEARVAATKSNLDAVRTRITFFRAKEGKYPESLGGLTSHFYLDAGVKKSYLKRLPKEMISSKKGNSTFEDALSDEPLSGDGGWAYYKDAAEVVIDVSTPLDKSWGDVEGEIPSKW